MKTVVTTLMSLGPGRSLGALCTIATAGVAVLLISVGVSAAQTGARNALDSDAGLAGETVLYQRSHWIEPPPLNARFTSSNSSDRRSGTVGLPQGDADPAPAPVAQGDSLIAAASTTPPKQGVGIVEAGYNQVAKSDAEPNTDAILIATQSEPDPDPDPDTTGDTAIRVVIHSNSTAGDLHRLFAETLETHDELELEQREVNFAITRHQMRFFYASDLLTGRALTDMLIEKLREHQGRNAEHIILKDFTHYTPGPEPGTLELWVH